MVHPIDYRAGADDPRRKMSRRAWLILGIILAVPAIPLASVVGSMLWWYVGFNERLRLADQHAPIVRQALEADGRFSDIHAESFTGQNGCLLVHAAAPPGTRDQLKAIVEATSPPVTVMYLIDELAPATQPSHSITP